MGNAPEKNDKFGNPIELEPQTNLAQKYATELKPENSIIYAAIAATKRSDAISEDANNPLYGIDEDEINKLAQEIMA